MTLNGGSKVHGDKVPDEHHVLRFVAWGRLRKDENDVVIGCLPAAFEYREDEEYLSVTWIEHFVGSAPDQLTLAAQAFRRGYFLDGGKGGAKAAFAKGNVGRMHAACAKFGAKIRVLHEPEDLNPGHVAVRRIPRDNQDLRALLADDVFTELTANSQIPHVP
jgi:hypothetical protein